MRVSARAASEGDTCFHKPLQRQDLYRCIWLMLHERLTAFVTSIDQLNTCGFNKQLMGGIYSQHALTKVLLTAETTIVV